MDLNNFQDSISFIKLEEKHFPKIKEFFKIFKNDRIKNINIQMQTKDKETEKLCKEYNIEFVYDVYQEIVVLNLNIDYNISNFNLDVDNIEDEDDLIELTADQRNDILGDIEKDLIEFIGYDEYDYIEVY